MLRCLTDVKLKGWRVFLSSCGQILKQRTWAHSEASSQGWSSVWGSRLKWGFIWVTEMETLDRVCVKEALKVRWNHQAGLHSYIGTVCLLQTLTGSALFVVDVLTLFWIMLMFALDQKCVCINSSLFLFLHLQPGNNGILFRISNIVHCILLKKIG